MLLECHTSKLDCLSAEELSKVCGWYAGEGHLITSEIGEAVLINFLVSSLFSKLVDFITSRFFFKICSFDSKHLCGMISTALKK